VDSVLTVHHGCIYTACFDQQWSSSCVSKIADNISRIEVIDGSTDSSVGTATDYRLDDWGVGVLVPVGLRIFLRFVQAGSEAYPASNPVGTGGSFNGR
jgi:hypothetical protein